MPEVQFNAMSAAAFCCAEVDGALRVQGEHFLVPRPQEHLDPREGPPAVHQAQSPAAALVGVGEEDLLENVIIYVIIYM